IVEAVVGLRRVAEISALSGAESPVGAAVIAGLEEWPGKGGGGFVEIPKVRLRGLQLVIGIGRFYQIGVLALAVDGEEQEGVVLLEGTADRAAELLAGVVGMRLGGATGSVRVLLVGIEGGVTKEADSGTVKLVGSAAGDDIDGSGFGAAVLGGKPLGAD